MESYPSREALLASVAAQIPETETIASYFRSGTPIEKEGSEILLVQSESEKRMLRILYYLRYLRAMIFNTTLTFIAAALYICFGITGVYPNASQWVNSVKASAELPLPINNITFTCLMILLLIVFFVLSYLSITRVWRKTLKAQAIFWLVCVILFAPGLVSSNIPVIENASPVFTALLFLFIGCVCWFSLDLVYSLWRVSQTPEFSSFRAALDTRLHSGFWALANKVLDLPRTPLRSLRSLSSYLLSLAGAIGLVMSLFYFVELGGVSSKAGELRSICGSDPGDCFEQSQGWAGSTLILLLVALAGIKVSLTVQALAKRRAALAVHDVLKDLKKGYILYLRSFGTDEVRLPRPKLPLISRIMSPWPLPARVEEELFDVADGYLPLIAVGRPGSKGKTEGGVAYREYLKDNEWRSYVEDKIRGSKHVVFLLNTTEGVLWELKHVLALGAGAKTLFLFDPKSRDEQEWQSIADAVIPIFVQHGLMCPTFRFFAPAIAFYFEGGRVVQIANSNWSATSYRTAFSNFLSEHSALSTAGRLGRSIGMPTGRRGNDQTDLGFGCKPS
jgi:hypothetical protein